MKSSYWLSGETELDETKLNGTGIDSLLKVNGIAFTILDFLPPEDGMKSVFVSKKFKDIRVFLTKIDLSKYPNITDKEIDEALAKTCKKLTHIDLTGCNKINDTAIEALTKTCQELTHINLTDCRQLNDKAI